MNFHKNTQITEFVLPAIEMWGILLCALNSRLLLLLIYFLLLPKAPQYVVVCFSCESLLWHAGRHLSMA